MDSIRDLEVELRDAADNPWQDSISIKASFLAVSPVLRYGCDARLRSRRLSPC